MLRFLIILFLLSGCGFKAVYNNTSYEKYLSHIEVESIPSIAGAELYRHLLDIMPVSKDIKFSLRIQFNSHESPMAISRNASILRENINQTIEYQLVEKQTGKILTSEKFNNTSSYSKNLSAYQAYIDSESKLEHLTRYAAEEIRTRLILYFEKQGL